jgi:hypothetical protein
MTPQQLAAIGIRAARAAYQRDRDNRYSLLEPWPLPAILRDLPPYCGPLVRFEPVGPGRTRLTVLPYDGDICDGASLAPDWPAGVVPAALLHDPLYGEIPAIARAWGWTEDQVRQLADEIFGDVLRRWRVERKTTRLGRWAAASRFGLAATYYSAVRHAGGLFRAHAKRLPLLAVVACLSLSGCGGCLLPPPILDPAEPLQPPVYEKTR